MQNLAIVCSETQNSKTPSIEKIENDAATRELKTTTFSEDLLETTVHLVQGKPSKNNLVRDKMNTQSIAECTFKRGGQCEKHGIKGKKSFTISKKWGRLKDGTYGNVSSRKTIWTSQCQITFTRESTIYPHNSDISSSDITDRLSGGLDLDYPFRERFEKVSTKRNLKGRSTSHRMGD